MAKTRDDVYDDPRRKARPGTAGGEGRPATEEPAPAPDRSAHEEALLRAQADLENLRRRGERELAKAHLYAIERFARDLLPVRDALERGLEAYRERGEAEELREGVELTLRQLADAFARHGIEPVEPLGERFDPERHEAMGTEPRADVAEGTVVRVYEKGYTLNERLLRPARVVVSSAAGGAG